MSAAHDVQALLSQLGSRIRLAGAGEAIPRAGASEVAGPLVLDWPELTQALPDGGLPRGVVELSAPAMAGGATSVALEAVRAGQARAAGAWCAWIDPEGTLHAPGVVAAGVDLARMLVVRAPREQLARTAVKVVASGAFEVVVLDVDAVRGTSAASAPTATGKKAWAPEVLVRKLALAAEPSATTVILLTDATRPRATAWPVALRLELARPDARSLAVRVAKDRRGRAGLARTVPFLPVTRLAV
jgi:recombination protein RecA